jgi:hypothetical protein
MKILLSFTFVVLFSWHCCVLQINSKPINDECVTAIGVDPPFVNETVNIMGDSTDAIPTVVDGLKYIGLHYQIKKRFIPVPSNNTKVVINYTICSHDILLTPAVFRFAGDDCGSLMLFSVLVADPMECLSFDYFYVDNVSIWFFIFLWKNSTPFYGEFDFTLSASYYSTPPNDKCATAMPFDALNGISITDFIMGSYNELYYKFDVGLQNDLVMDLSFCTADAGYVAMFVAKGDNCKNLFDLVTFYDSGACDVSSFIVTKNSTYIVLLALSEVVSISMKGQIVNPPPNGECDGAFLIDPVVIETISGDNRGSITGNLFYKVVGGFVTDIALNVTVCKESKVSYAFVDIYQGNDCINSFDGFLVFDNCMTIPIILTKQKPYIFQIGLYNGKNVPLLGKFNLTIDIIPNYFGLIDAKRDIVIGLLEGYLGYDFLPSTLNIQANFDQNITVHSVLMTFDNPNLSFCERNAPFAVFGDIKGNFKGVIIPLGMHVVTATSFAQSSCKGPPGPQLTQKFNINGCNLEYYIMDNNGNNYYVGYNDDTMYILPCPFNIEVIVQCGFEPQIVQLVLQHSNTKKIVISRKEHVSPYTLSKNGIKKTLLIGNYTLSATIDGIFHPPKATFVVNSQCN